MKIGILQPGYLPWLGFFEQIYRTDKFVLYDDVQYTAKDWRNRNRIKTVNGPLWLTVPVQKMPRETQIRDIKINYDQNWQKNHLTSIRVNYSKASFFQQYFPIIEKIISNRFIYLEELDNQLVFVLVDFLGIKKEFVLSSSLGLKETDKNLRVLEICQKLKADYLYDGKSAQEFIDVELFRKNGVTVEFQNYQHPRYHQLFGEFIPYLPVIDLLFNHGPESLDILIGKKIVS